MGRDGQISVLTPIAYLLGSRVYVSLVTLKLRGQYMMRDSIDSALAAKAGRLSGLFRRYASTFRPWSRIVPS